MVSGDGASTKSTWPDSSAAARVEASGIGSSTTRSCLGAQPCRIKRQRCSEVITYSPFNIIVFK